MHWTDWYNQFQNGHWYKVEDNQLIQWFKFDHMAYIYWGTFSSYEGVKYFKNNNCYAKLSNLPDNVIPYNSKVLEFSFDEYNEVKSKAI